MIILYLSTRRPQIPGHPCHVIHCFLKFRISKNPVLQDQEFFSKNRQKIINFFFEGLRPAPPPYGAAHLANTKVGSKCLAAVVLDNRTVHFTQAQTTLFVCLFVSLFV